MYSVYFVFNVCTFFNSMHMCMKVISERQVKANMLCNYGVKSSVL